MSFINPFAGTALDVPGYLISVTPFMLEGMLVSLLLATVGLICGLFLAVPLALARSSSNKILSILATVYIEFFRGTPLTCQLFIVYFGLPQLGLTFDRMAASCIALLLNSAAYQSEYLRGALNCVDPGQMIAAKSLGMSYSKSVWSVLIPQWVRLAIPPWTNEAIYIVKSAAVCFIVSVPDLLAKAKLLVSWHFRPVEVYIYVAILYVLLLNLLSFIYNKVEKKIEIPGLLTDSIQEK